MKRFCALIALLCLIMPLGAQTPDDQYIEIYALIQKGMSLEQGQERTPALATYREAQTALLRFQKGYPDWQPGIVSFRLKFLTSKIDEITSKLNNNRATAPVSPIPPSSQSTGTNIIALAELQNQLAALHDQVKQLQAEKTALEAKLKEALALQPSTSDPRELANALERIQALEKENEALKVAAQENAGKVANGAYEKQVEALRSRVELLEARIVPYTAEELALFRDAPFTLDAPEKLAENLPPGGVALMAEADRYSRSGELDKAVTSYNKILLEDRGNAVALGSLALVRMQQGKLDEAEQLLRQALVSNPNNSLCLYTLGMIKHKQKNYDEAVDVLNRAAQWEPKNPEILNRLGLVLSEKGLRGPAETALRKAVQLRPGFAEAHNNLAVVYITQKPPMPELARWHYQKAVAAGYAKNAELEARLGTN